MVVAADGMIDLKCTYNAKTYTSIIYDIETSRRLDIDLGVLIYYHRQ